MTVLDWLPIAFGGGLGAIARGWLTHLGNRRAPWGTLAVNWGGSALLGLIIGLAPDWSDAFWLGAVVGFCGALTTFSTCLVEAAKWWRAGLRAQALAYLGATFGGSLGLVVLALEIGPDLSSSW